MQQRSDRPSLYYVEDIQVKKTYQRQAPVYISMRPLLFTSRQVTHGSRLALNSGTPQLSLQIHFFVKF